MHIIPNRKIFYILSGVLVGASLILLGVSGLKFGLDFTGGSLLEIEYGGTRPENEEIRASLLPFNLGAMVIQETGEHGVLLRFKEVDEATHQKILEVLKLKSQETKIQGPGSVAGPEETAFGTEKRFDTVGPVIGQELKRRSVYSILLVLVLIVFYIAWAFRKVSRPVSSWKYGVIAVIALFHDVFIPTGIFALLGKLYGVEIDTLFVTALLTVLGFSVHDTIVVFDRVRENLKRMGTKMPFEEIVESSVKETFVRSVNTSLTVLLALGAVFLFGGESIRYFTLALIIGVVVGTYSSIFIASPLLVTWHHFQEKR